jgi:DNA primase
VPTPATRAALRAAAASTPEHLREAVILATLVAHPTLIEEFAHRLEETEFSGAGHAALAHALLSADVLGTEEQVRHDIAVRLGPGALERVTAPRHVQLSPGLRRKGDIEAARACVAGEFDRLEAARGSAREVAEAMDMLARVPAAEAGALAEEAGTYTAGPAANGGTADEDAYDGGADGRADYGGTDGTDDAAPQEARDTITWRLADAARSRGATGSLNEADRTEYDIAENGARVDRRERGAFEALLRSIGHGASRPGGADGDD